MYYNTKSSFLANYVYPVLLDDDILYGDYDDIDLLPPFDDVSGYDDENMSDAYDNETDPLFKVAPDIENLVLAKPPSKPPIDCQPMPGNAIKITIRSNVTKPLMQLEQKCTAIIIFYLDKIKANIR